MNPKALKVGVQTANGSHKSLKGYCRMQIKFQNKVKDINLFVCASLEQQLHLDIDFIKMFNLAPELFPHSMINEVTRVEDPKKNTNLFPSSEQGLGLIEEEFDRLLRLGVVEPSESCCWRSPVTLVCKPGKNRLCLESRKLNKVTKPLAYPIPSMERLLSRLKDTNRISSIDLKDAFL